jgi:hypothetical protein
MLIALGQAVYIFLGVLVGIAAISQELDKQLGG